MKTRKTYAQIVSDNLNLYNKHFTPVQQAYDWSMPVLPSSVAHFALRMTIINLLDALYWELDWHTNAQLLMQGSIDRAYIYSDGVY